MEMTWDYLPFIGYEGEGLTLALRPVGGSAGWSASDADGAAITLTGDQQTVAFSITPSATHHDRIQLMHGAEHIVIDFIQPGAGSGLSIGPQGHLRLGESLAVLVLPRIEAQADRRWAMLGLLESPAVDPCAVVLADAHVAWGEPALLAQICASQRQGCAGTGVLVRLSGADRLASWKHRDYREAVAWLVADLLARSATRVVLVEPLAPAAENTVMQPLRTQIADVGHAYHCRVVDSLPLARDTYWDIADGVLGTALNARGVAALDDLLRPFLHQP
jgi:hypothetical protein